MFKHYLRIAMRTTLKQKGYSAVNTFGLAVGITCCLLIFLFVRHEWSYDRFHAKADRIYRVLIEEKHPDGSLGYRFLMPPSLAPAMSKAFPGIEALSRVVVGNRDVRFDNQVFNERLLMADSTFLDLFTFPFLAGDPNTALRDPQGIVLTAPIARKYFGDRPFQDMLHRTLSIERGTRTYSFTITGVMAPIPETSSLQFDLLLSFAQYENLPIGGNDSGGRTSLYLLLAEKQELAVLEAAMRPFVTVQLANFIEARRKSGDLADVDDAVRLALQPLKQLHLDTRVNSFYEQPTHNPLYSYILAAIAFLVLSIACMNFILLSLGHSASRAREVGMRKVLGAYRVQLMKQFWGEALVVTLLAFALGIIFAELTLPNFNQLTGLRLSFSNLTDWGSLAVIAGLVVLVGLAAGSYPAAKLSRFQPAVVLKGKVKTHGKQHFSRSLVILQYSISVALIICTLVMYRQFDYLLTRDLGFDGEQVVVVHTPRLSTTQERTVLEVFRNALVGYEQIAGIAKTSHSFTRNSDVYGWNAPEGTAYSAHVFGVDFDYLDVLGLKMIAGRFFSRDFITDSTHSVVVNEAFVRTYDIKNPINHKLTGFNGFFGEVDPTIIGVVKDFNFRSLHEKVAPAILNLHPAYYMGMQAILVKIRSEDSRRRGDRFARTLAVLEDVWKHVFPDKPFVYSFLDADMDAQYQAERRWRTILTDAALLAVLIACLGLFALATLTVARRTKEIGVRKALGASVLGIVGLLSKEFIKLVVIAIVIASPLAYYVMNRWLEDFAYRIDISWWVFALSGGLALLIALLTVSAQAIKAALANPVEALRYE